MKLYKNRYTVICDAKTLLQALQNILSEFLLYVYSVLYKPNFNVLHAKG